MENREIVIKKGLKVSILSAVFIAIGMMTMIASFWAISELYNKYDAMTVSYQTAEIEREAADSFKLASDYLTDQARQFAINGDIKNAENYFEEKDIIKRREAALDLVGNSQLLELENDLLSNAFEQSEELVKYEVHAMKLISVAKMIDETKLPAEVVSFELPQEELGLDDEQKQKLAVELLYSKDYDSYKSMINWEVENASTLIKEISGTQYREDEADMISLLNIATVLIFIMFILLMLIFIFNTLLVVRPAKMFAHALDKKEKLPEIGGYELRKFARKYNDIYRSDRKNKELLKEQGEIDELTGTLKVGTLDLIRHNLSQSNEALGIMLIDIDNFRSIKEANGYDMADKVVAKVANLFLSAFKSGDYIVRISQDEFEIFLPKMQQSDSEMLVDRIAKINQKLQDAADGVVAASVSVGVAFSEKGYTAEAEQKADMALNNVKKTGRGSCKIM